MLVTTTLKKKAEVGIPVLMCPKSGGSGGFLQNCSYNSLIFQSAWYPPTSKPLRRPAQWRRVCKGSETRTTLRTYWLWQARSGQLRCFLDKYSRLCVVYMHWQLLGKICNSHTPAPTISSGCVMRTHTPSVIVEWGYFISYVAHVQSTLVVD